MTSASASIVVVGSLNIDHTLSVAHLPAPGETVSADAALTCYGGKGANQALSAARSGAAVSLVACCGDDAAGAEYLAFLAAQGIDTSGVNVAAGGEPTGAAFIVVDAEGENTIVVNSGANFAVDAAMVDARKSSITGADVLLLQLECPLPAVRRAAQIARAAGVKVIINPSPWSVEFAAAGIPCDVWIVNESEAAGLGGAESAIHSDFARDVGLEMIVVTGGGGLTRAFSRDADVVEQAPRAVSPVDTVGAGDSFAGAFAVALAEGRAVPDALAFANAAGTLATLKLGAQTAIPLRSEIEEWLAGG